NSGDPVCGRQDAVIRLNGRKDPSRVKLRGGRAADFSRGCVGDRTGAMACGAINSALLTWKFRSGAKSQRDTPSPPADGGEGRGEEATTPLLVPLPTPSSWGRGRRTRAGANSRGSRRFRQILILKP